MKLIRTLTVLATLPCIILAAIAGVLLAAVESAYEMLWDIWSKP